MCDQPRTHTSLWSFHFAQHMSIGTKDHHQYPHPKQTSELKTNQKKNTHTYTLPSQVHPNAMPPYDCREPGQYLLYSTVQPPQRTILSTHTHTQCLLLFFVFQHSQAQPSSVPTHNTCTMPHRKPPQLVCTPNTAHTTLNR